MIIEWDYTYTYTVLQHIQVHMHLETLTRSRSALAASKAFDEEIEVGSFTYNGFPDAVCAYNVLLDVGSIFIMLLVVLVDIRNILLTQSVLMNEVLTTFLAASSRMKRK